MTLDVKKFGAALMGTASRAAEALANMTATKQAVTGGGLAVTAKAGKPGTPYRRIIKQTKLPVWFVQTGIKAAGPDGWVPILEKIERHQFLHATKGYRVYRDGLPGPGTRSRYISIPTARNPARQSALAPWRPAKMVDGRLVVADIAA
jgi:hypothetical protein